MRVAAGNGKRAPREFVPLQNKCMELRKVANHPYLTYPGPWGLMLPPSRPALAGDRPGGLSGGRPGDMLDAGRVRGRTSDGNLAGMQEYTYRDEMGGREGGGDCAQIYGGGSLGGGEWGGMGQLGLGGSRHGAEEVVRVCGKLMVLDRVLLKLRRTGHKVLLFSTMTRLLDVMEGYLQWRGLPHLRIDGHTPLDQRETAIDAFNSPDSDIFTFLLSIKAAGRGLNLQTADTVVIYDPDPNPKNEEQAVARAHRIGQKREVRVLYMEAVVEVPASYEGEGGEKGEKRKGTSGLDFDCKDGEGREGREEKEERRKGRRRKSGKGKEEAESEEGGGGTYVGSIESLVRSKIQQRKIEMADEVINAGRFDQQTTQEERRTTLEEMLHDAAKQPESVSGVPTMKVRAQGKATHSDELSPD